MTKIYGERGSPCLIPQLLPKNPLGEPFTRIENEGLDRSIYPFSPFWWELHAMHYEINKFSVETIKGFLKVYLDASSHSMFFVEVLTSSRANSEHSPICLPSKNAC